MNTWEAMLIQKYDGIGRLITEQQRPDHNPLYDLVSFTDTSEAGEQQQDITHSARGHTAIILKISYDSQPQ